MQRGAITVTLAVFSALTASGAGASVPDPDDHDGLSERELRALETRTLGPEHAREHALARRAAREGLTGAMPAQSLSAEDAGDPAQVGAWTTEPFELPNFAVHSAVLPTGKVLFWGTPPVVGGLRPNEGRAALWDPELGTGPGSLRSVPPPEIDADGDGDTEPAPIYCAGQSFLPSGALLVTGGNLVALEEPDDYLTFAGHSRAFTFDPWAETWTEQPAMRHGRWYPSQALMADGRTAIVSGFDERAPGGILNGELELFIASESPAGIGAMRHVPSGDRLMQLYPHLFTLPSGDLALAGGDRDDVAVLDGGALAWTELESAPGNRSGGSAVLMPAGPDGSAQVMQIGGFDPASGLAPDGNWPAIAGSDGIDFAAADPAWSAGASLTHERESHNTVLLPDGSMLTVGGGRGYSPSIGAYLTHEDGRLRRVEIYDPDSRSWRLGPAQQEDRTYHSTAMLLPDGRVISAGDDVYPSLPEGGPSLTDTAEVYSPPYLFRGPRPQISAAPASIRWGESFGVSTPSPEIERAVLMAPSSTTHGVDMHQRHVELELEGVAPGEGLTVRAPPWGGVAPPGRYMLFLVNDEGVPSVARWIDLRGGAAVAAGTRDALPPTVRVRLLRALGPDQKPALTARVRVDQAAGVRLSLKVTAGARKLGATSAVLRFRDAGVRRLAIRLRPGAPLHAWRARVKVRADSADGFRTRWRRTVRVTDVRARR